MGIQSPTMDLVPVDVVGTERVKLEECSIDRWLDGALLPEI